MSAVLDSSGLTIQSFDAVLEEIIAAIGSALGLTAAQTQRMREGVQSTLGQLARIEAERDVVAQESLLAVYDTLSILAEGAALDRVVQILGMTRIPAALSRVTGTAAGTAGTEIPAGARLRYNPTSTTWVVFSAATISGGGSVALTIERETAGADEVALDPDTGFDDWTILDTVVGWSDVGAFESSAQPIVGREVETDAALRSRASVEAFRRATGPIKAIESAILEVDGVTYARVYENRTLESDANGIPAKAINAIVSGGDAAEIAAAIFSARSAGSETYGTSETEDVTDSYGFVHSISFDRVTEVPVWIRCTLTTSTAEDTAPVGITDTVETLLLAQALASFGVGADVRPYVLSGAVFAAALPGIDAVLVELSTDGSSWGTAKIEIGIRERATFSAAHTSVLED